MPLNQLKKYPDLLDIMSLNEYQRMQSLRLIYDRDIQDNENLTLLKKVIRPIKIDGKPSFDTVFNHLIKEESEFEEDGKIVKRRIFEKDRAQRLHWVKYQIELNKKAGIEVFSTEERDAAKRKNVFRTYIYDIEREYVVILEPQNSGRDYYLLSAYYLNKSWAPKSMRNKMKKKLPDIL